jgi:hypothetical protein
VKNINIGNRTAAKTGLPWVNCDGHQNKKTKEYSAKLELMNAATQVC